MSESEVCAVKRRGWNLAANVLIAAMRPRWLLAASDSPCQSTPCKQSMALLSTLGRCSACSGESGYGRDEPAMLCHDGLEVSVPRL